MRERMSTKDKLKADLKRRGATQDILQAIDSIDEESVSSESRVLVEGESVPLDAGVVVKVGPRGVPVVFVPRRG